MGGGTFIYICNKSQPGSRLSVANQSIASSCGCHGVDGSGRIVVHLLDLLLQTCRVPELDREVALDDGEVTTSG